VIHEIANRKHAMSSDQRILQLLENMLDSGSSPEAVCADCPELLPAVKDRWKQYKGLEAEVEAMFPASVPGVADCTATSSCRNVPPSIPGYEILGVLGHGGMGVVYRARHLKLNRSVALKMLLTGVYASPTEVTRFSREAKLIAGLQHPHLVQVHDVGDSDGCPYFTMELVEGGSLAQLLAGVPQPPLHAAKMVSKLALAVQAAHDGGIVHRDLKPSNILLTADGVPKISDFGLARRVEEDADLTLSGARIGTPSYMAPEQITNRTGEVGALSDIYSLGAILYEMLTGRPPFRADTAADTERQLVTDEPARPSRLNTKVPRDLETICLKCLQKDPQRRYASAAALADDLHRFTNGEPITARPVGTVERTVKWARRRPAQAVTLASIFILALAITGVMVWLIAAASARTRRVESELQSIASLESQGRWDDARAIAAQAHLELGSHGPVDLRRRLEQCDSDLDLVARLDAIQYNEMGTLANERGIDADDRYLAALREYGIEPFSPDKTAVESRIEHSPIRIALIDTLDQWDLVIDTAVHRAWLLEVARDADENQTPWQRSARDPEKWNKLSEFETVIDTAPISERSVSLLYALAWHYQSLKESPVPLLTKIQQDFPTQLRANLMLGMACRENGDSAGAIRYFQAAVSTLPRKAIAESNLGAVLYSAGHDEEAIVHYENAIKLQPSLDRCYCNLALALSRVGRTQEAIDQILIAEKLSPQDSVPYIDLGKIYDRLPDQKQAVDAYRNALLRDPTLTIAAYQGRPAMRGIAAWEQLWPGFKKSIGDDPPKYPFWPMILSLGLYLEHEDDYRATRTLLLQHANEITDPETAERCSRACLLLPASEQETRTAAAMIERVAKSDLSKFNANVINYVQLTQALAELRLGHPQTAVDLLRGGPSTVLLPMPQLILAIAQQQVGQTEDARKTLASAISMFDWSHNRAIDPDAWTFHILRREAEQLINGNVP
jgi:tetratricopeptide (TPR) repeat protein/tRNA A-37 threonylcarbamoyl transferase component Bud32